MKALPKRLIAGLLLVAAGQSLSVVHILPLSYFYFPVVWYGYILTLDGSLEAAGGVSLWVRHRQAFLAMIPISAGFWWLFELFNVAVHSWRYVGAGAFTGVEYVAFASVCFSTVLLAVWETALALTFAAQRAGLPLVTSGAVTQGLLSRVDPISSTEEPGAPSYSEHDHAIASHTSLGKASAVRNIVLFVAPALGCLCILLPVFFPRYAFALIWGSLFLLLDPVNGWVCGRSLLLDALKGTYGVALVFAGAALICGFFWEFWNYWAAIKWVYNVPYVSQAHLFEMPLPGYLGYLPFGLEVYAATVLIVPALLRLGAPFWLPISDARRPVRPIATASRGPETARPE